MRYGGQGSRTLRLQLLDVAGWRPAEHRFVGVEGVLDLAIEIEIVLRRLRRHRRQQWLVEAFKAMVANAEQSFVERVREAEAQQKK
jgi:hypothetical protein